MRVLMVLATLTAAALGAAEKAVDRLPTVTDAALAAYADLKKLPVHDRPFQWYVFVGPGSHNDWTAGRVEDRRSVGYAVNHVARRPDPVKYVTVTPWLIRYDLRAIAPLIDDLGDLLKLREDFRFDPTFSTLITPDMRRLNNVEVVEVRQFSRWYVPHDDGGHHWEMRPKTVRVVKGVARLNDPSLPPEYVALQEEMLTEAPIVDARYLVLRAMSQNPKQYGSADVFGGRYYDFVGIKKAEKGTDEDQFLRGLGVIKENENATRFFEALGAESRSAMYRSKVTFRPRRVDFLPTRGALTGGWVSITHDPADGDQDVEKDPMYALLDLKDAAREVIAARANGLHLFALFNAQGELQDFVPQNVGIRDTTTPHEDTLQPGISCIRCHGASNGIHDVTNDVARARARGARQAAVNLNAKPDFGVLDLLDAKYRADPKLLITRGRGDYSRGAVAATELPANADAPMVLSKALGEMYGGYVYDPVDAREVLADLGVKPPGDVGKAAALLEKLLPVAIDKPLTKAEQDLLHLQGGGVVGRFQYSVSRSYMLGRAKK